MQTIHRRNYPSDMNNLQWHFVQKLIPPEKQLGRHRSVDLREIANAIHYRWRTGCVWRMLPHDFPPWETVYSYYRDWQIAGILTDLREILIRNRFPELKSQQVQVSSPTNRNSAFRKRAESEWTTEKTHPLKSRQKILQ